MRTQTQKLLKLRQYELKRELKKIVKELTIVNQFLSRTKDKARSKRK